MVKYVFTSFFILIFLIGCQKESDIIPFQKTKSALLGKWNLVSYEYQEYKYDDSPGLHFSGVTTDSTGEVLEFTEDLIVWYYEDALPNKWPYRITSDTTLIFTIDINGDRNVTLEELSPNKLVTTTRYPTPSLLGRVVTKHVYKR